MLLKQKPKPVLDHKSIEVLRDAISLKRNSRNNAANSRWSDLSSAFRDKVCELAIAVAEYGDEFPYRSVTLDSPYGRMVLSKENIDCNGGVSFSDLLDIVPNLTVIPF